VDSLVSVNFVDKAYAEARGIPMQQKVTPRQALTVDGSEVTGGPVTHDSQVHLTINHHKEDIRLHCITIGNAPIINNKIKENSKTSKDPIPPKYNEFLEVFTEKEPTAPPPHCTHDQHIPLEEGKTPPYKPLRPLNEEKTKGLKEYLEVNEKQGWIRASISSWGSRRRLENSLPNLVRTIRVLRHAFRVDQCTSAIPTMDERDSE